MRVHLHRFVRWGPEGIGGEIIFGEARLYCLELPDRDNEPYVSCVPKGLYRLAPTQHGKSGLKCWALIGETVSNWPEAWAQRSRCLVGEVANVATELQGCIATGMTLGFHGGKHAVLDSRDANTMLNRFLARAEDHELLIQEKWGGTE